VQVGGLGDVVTALGRAVQEAGNLVEVILPRSATFVPSPAAAGLKHVLQTICGGCSDVTGGIVWYIAGITSMYCACTRIKHCQTQPARRRYDFFLSSPLLGATQYETEFDFAGMHVFVSTCVVEGLRCFFIEPQNGFFAVDAVYGRRDDGMRFEFFCRVRHPVLTLCLASKCKACFMTVYHWCRASRSIRMKPSSQCLPEVHSALHRKTGVRCQSAAAAHHGV